jgi:hypothetical protein
MKSMAMTTFIVFTLAVLARGFSQHNTKILQTKTDHNTERLFEQKNKEQLKADLLALNDVYPKAPSDQHYPQSDLAENIIEPELIVLEREYFESFIQNFISFEDIRARQNEIVDLKVKNNKSLLPSDTFDLHLIYYLLIVEGMDIRDINQIQSLYELFPNDPELANLNRYILSDTFTSEILSYLGVNEEDHIDQESLALSLVPVDSYHGDLSDATDESSDWIRDQQRAFASEEQEAIYKHLQEFRVTPEEVRELVQGYQVSLPRY